MVTLTEAYIVFKRKYAIYLLPLFFGAILYVLAIALQTIYLIMAIGYFILIIPEMSKQLSEKYAHKDDEDIAWEYLKQKWFEKTGETLSIRDGWSTSTYFGDKGRCDLFYAFVVRRGETGDKQHQPFVGVIQVEPLRKAGWDDEPSLELQKDPFKVLSTSFRGTPSPDMKPEFETSLRSTYPEKKSKDKKQNDAVENTPNNMVTEE